MRKACRMLSFCAIALPLLALGTSANAAMTGAQIKAAASGKKFSFTSPTSHGTVAFGSGGSLAIHWISKSKSGNKTGSWWVSDNKLCTKRTRTGSKGKKTTACNSWTQLGGGKIKSTSGSTLTPK